MKRKNLFNKFISILFIVVMVLIGTFNFVFRNTNQVHATPGVTISYDGNGATDGQVPEDIYHYALGSNIEVLDNENILLKTDCIFDGWNTESDGSGTAYQPGDTITVSELNNIILYAVWVPVYKTKPTKDNNYTLEINPELLTDYDVYYDWFKEGNDPMLGTNPYSEAITFPSTITLEDSNYYCRITLSQGSLYSGFVTQAITPKEIKFDGNSATDGIAPTTIYQLEGRSITLPENSFTKTDYQFVSWQENENEYAVGTTYQVGANDVVFTAKWQDINKQIVGTNVDSTNSTLIKITLLSFISATSFIILKKRKH